MRTKTVIALALLLLLGPWATSLSAAAPEGQMTWAVHVSLAPTWFDPAETAGVIVPFMVLYALHDALVKPMPGQPMAPSLAESWTSLYRDQAREMDPKKREALLHRIQHLVHEKVMFAPIVEPAFLHGARVAEPGLGLIVGHLYSAPYEDLRLKK